jgi:type VI secretion system protein ImpJ
VIRLVPHLVKVSSNDRISTLVRQALPGAALTPTPSPPSAVPIKLDYEYFQVDRTGSEWAAIVRARNLAAYVPSELGSAELELVFLLAARG